MKDNRKLGSSPHKLPKREPDLAVISMTILLIIFWVFVIIKLIGWL